MRTKARETFTTIRTEGAILPPDLLARIERGDKDLGGLDPASYHLSGETIGEAINRSWSRLQGAWEAFKGRRETLPEGEPETGMTRERWLLPLFEELRYGRLRRAEAVEIEGKSYPVSHDWYGTPIHLVGFRTDLDRRTPGVAGAARTSPHSLVQELLNRSEERLWAFLSNGLRLRILRDNVSLTRQAYVEFDLEAMMDGEVYPDFVLLWLLCHQSRVEADRPEESWLERWSRSAAERGTRALEGLRGGVEEAIRSLGSGFLSHRANEALRARLHSGELSTQDYYRQLLRTVYRMLFLFVAEDRGLLLDPKADPKAAERYTRYYSTAKLRNLAEKRVGHRHSDLYRGFSLVVQKLGDERGYPELGLPALGGFLFNHSAVPDLEGAEISNRDLLDAVRALSLVEYDGQLRPVDYKNLGAEELGSVYESLLELHPVLDMGAGAFALETVGGNERKTTGSYYTPDSLVNSLLDTALDPVLDGAAGKPDPEAEILALKVCDPAVGSGHFLIAAAHRIAKRLAAVRTGDDEPSPEATREALREVISNCLYGVDVNPMAAELCRFNLLMEALVPGCPLSFLDHHIKVGNSLLGTTPDLITNGIPDDAFKPIEGDDKQLTRAYAKRNREERKQWQAGQLVMSLRTLDNEQEALERGYAAVENADERSVREVREKAARYAALESSPDKSHSRLVADAWCAAFVWSKTKGVPEPITQEVFADLTHRSGALSQQQREEIERIRESYDFFHWHLEFPGVLSERDPGGFDVVLGNPPWEHTELKEQEWFATRRPDIAVAPGAKRKRMINELAVEDPGLYQAFREDLRVADGFSQFVRSSGRFPLCGRGRINTYAIFAETNRSIISPTGRVGCIVPSGIATDNTTKEFFGDLLNTKTLASLYEFENVGFFGVGQGHMVRFALLTMLGEKRRVDMSDFLFQGQYLQELGDPDRHFSLSAKDIRLLNPNTRTCPIFRTRRDAEITKSIYRRTPVLIDENKKDGNPWRITFKQGLFNMTSDSSLFRTRDELEAEGWELEGNVFQRDSKRYLPLYEAKMFFHYNHRFGDFGLLSPGSRGHVLPSVPVSLLQQYDYAPLPRYWVPEIEVKSRLSERWSRNWLLGWRDVTDARASARTVIFSVMPMAGVGHTAPLITPDIADAKYIALLQANFSAFAHDYAARQKIGGIHLTFGYLN